MSAIKSVLCTSLIIWFGSNRPDTEEERTEQRELMVLYCLTSRTWTPLESGNQQQKSPLTWKQPRFTPGRRDRSMYAFTARHKNSFFPQADQHLNLSHTSFLYDKNSRYVFTQCFIYTKPKSISYWPSVKCGWLCVNYSSSPVSAV